MLSILLKSYVVIPALMILISLIIKKKDMSKYMFIFTVVIGFMSFHLQEPNQKSDLFWHYQTLRSFKTMGLEYFSEFNKSESLPVYGLYFYLISLLPDERFLPAITAFLVYGMNFYIIYRLSKRFELDKRGIIILMIFVLCNLNYSGVIMGIRFNLAVTTCFLGLYLDIVEKKSILITWPLYVLSLLMHSSIYIMLLVRLLVILFSGRTKNLSALALTGFTVIFLKTLPDIVKYLPIAGINQSIDEFFFKADMYLKNIEQGAFWTVPYYFCLIIFFAYIGIRFFSRYKWCEEKLGKTVIYYFLLIVISIVFFNNYVVLGRIVIMYNVVSLPIIAIMLKERQSRSYNVGTVTYVEAIVFSESMLRLIYYLTLGGYGAIKLIW